MLAHLLNTLFSGICTSHQVLDVCVLMQQMAHFHEIEPPTERYMKVMSWLLDCVLFDCYPALMLQWTCLRMSCDAFFLMMSLYRQHAMRHFQLLKMHMLLSPKLIVSYNHADFVYTSPHAARMSKCPSCWITWLKIPWHEDSLRSRWHAAARLSFRTQSNGLNSSD